MHKRNTLILKCVEILGIASRDDLLHMQGDLLENLLHRGIINHQQKNYIHFFVAYYSLLQGFIYYGQLNDSQAQNLMQSKLDTAKNLEHSLSQADQKFLQRDVADKVALELHRSKVLIDKEYTLIQSWLKDLDVSKQDAKLPQIGEYKILAIIGSGGMGKVYKAYHTILQKDVAIKVLLNLQNASEKTKQRFFNEARAMSQLHHSNIVQIHDVGSHGGVYYIVMDYIEGISLREYMKNQRMTIRKSCQFMQQIIHAVALAHKHKIAHRDLKPSNLLVKDNKIYLMDFGLAKDLKQDQDLTNSGQILGTPKYMSPEQAEGRSKNIDLRTDIYALGVIFYEMLTGVCPIQGSSQSKVIYNILHGDIKPMSTYNKQISSKLEAICRKAMSRSINERYQDVCTMNDDIQSFLEGKSLSVRSNSVLQHVDRNRKKYVKLMLTLSLMVFLITVGIFLGRTSSHVREEPQSHNTSETKPLSSASKNNMSVNIDLDNNAQDVVSNKKVIILTAHSPVPYLELTEDQIKYYKHDPKKWKLWYENHFAMRYNVKRSWTQQRSSGNDYTRVIHSNVGNGKVIFHFIKVDYKDVRTLVKVAEKTIARVNRGQLFQRRRVNVRLYDMYGIMTTYFLKEEPLNFYLQVYCAIRNGIGYVCIARRPEDNLEQNQNLVHSILSLSPFEPNETSHVRNEQYRLKYDVKSHWPIQDLRAEQGLKRTYGYLGMQEYLAIHFIKSDNSDMTYWRKKLEMSGIDKFYHYRIVRERKFRVGGIPGIMVTYNFRHKRTGIEGRSKRFYGTKGGHVYGIYIVHSRGSSQKEDLENAVRSMTYIE